uniref:Uncharacterized protein n=13 Tax=Cellia TaxID=44534 RepID=A0A182YA45_ANOST
MDIMASNLQQQRAITEQLRREAAIQRITVSQAVADIVKYVTEHQAEDCLLVGFSSQKVNPFREKSSCSILIYPEKLEGMERSRDANGPMTSSVVVEESEAQAQNCVPTS